jgi:hypothetical protein
MLKIGLQVLLVLSICSCFAHNKVKQKYKGRGPMPMGGPGMPGPGPSAGAHGPGSPSPAPVPPQKPGTTKSVDAGNASEATKALVKAVANAGGRSVDGTLDPKICAITDQYAQKLASIQRLDNHDGSSDRAARIGGNASEIIAESYGIERSLEEHAASCVYGWEHSHGHKVQMDAYHPSFCYSMAQGNNGRYFCVGLFNDGSGGSTTSENTDDSSSNSGKKGGWFRRHH